MKKSVIALLVSGLAVASVQAAPQANTFYAGAKAGWVSSHDGIKEMKEAGLKVTRDSETYGVFGGYQITNNVAVELGYDYFGRMKAKAGNVLDSRHTAHGTSLSLKGSYPIVDGLDAYARVGAALVRNDYKALDTATGTYDKAHRLQTSAVFAGGLEYAVIPSLALRLEYQWLNNVGDEAKAYKETGDSYRPDMGSVSLGLSYRFGQGAAPVAAPEVVTKNFAFSSDVLFDFGKSSLKLAATAALDAANDEINKLGLSSAAIQVSGYTDRIGSEAYNLKLSQDRAESVANYMVSKGVNPANISATGYGKANPVTGNTCDAVKGRKALIACLAPDRRVELQVQGSKEITM